MFVVYNNKFDLLEFMKAYTLKKGFFRVLIRFSAINIQSIYNQSGVSNIDINAHLAFKKFIQTNCAAPNIIIGPSVATVYTVNALR